MACKKNVVMIVVSNYDGWVTVYHKSGNIYQYEGWALCPKYIQNMKDSAVNRNCFHWQM